MSELVGIGDGKWEASIYLIGYLDFETTPQLSFEIEAIVSINDFIHKKHDSWTEEY